MSTKTTFKRIALVAVAALGLGVLTSVAPASAAANTNFNCTASYYQAANPDNACSGVAGPANFVTVTASTLAVYVVLTGGTFTDGTTSKTLAAAGTANIATPAAGTITANGYAITNGVASSTAQAVTITVLAAANAGTVSTTTSTSVNKAGSVWAAGTSATTDDTVVVGRAASLTGTPGSVVKVSLGQVSGAITGTTAVTASISGAGSLILNNDADHTTSPIGAGRSLSSTVTATGETFYVYVLADGTAGVGTVSITVGAFTATETVSFVGSAASYVATQTRKVYAGTTAPSTPGAQTITVAVKDSAGLNVIDGTTVYAASATTTVATIDASATTTAGVATFTVTGAAAGTSVITFGNAASSATVTTTTTITVGSASIAAVAMTTDKASYLPGERITLTVTATSADGKPVADGSYTLFSTAPTSSMALSAGTLPASGVVAVGGVAGGLTATLNAPLSENSFTISGKDNLSALNTISVSAVVENAASTAAAQAATDAAAEATDAANAATDAANAAAEAADAATAAAQDAADAVAALSTQVAEMIDALKKQITALTNLVIKIQKKVKA
jgi:trimeric autotransporter adhesin